jgi:hypothetical protein
MVARLGEPLSTVALHQLSGAFEANDFQRAFLSRVSRGTVFHGYVCGDSALPSGEPSFLSSALVLPEF